MKVTNNIQRMHLGILYCPSFPHRDCTGKPTPAIGSIGGVLAQFGSNANHRTVDPDPDAPREAVPATGGIGKSGVPPTLFAALGARVPTAKRFAPNAAEPLRERQQFVSFRARGQLHQRCEGRSKQTATAMRICLAVETLPCR
jgi:hypothetical protein